VWKTGRIFTTKRVPLISISEPCSTSAGFIHSPSFPLLPSLWFQIPLWISYSSAYRRRTEKRYKNDRRGKIRNVRRHLFSLINSKLKYRTPKPIHFPLYQSDGDTIPRHQPFTSYHFCVNIPSPILLWERREKFSLPHDAFQVLFSGLLSIDRLEGFTSYAWKRCKNSSEIFRIIDLFKVREDS